MIMGDGWYTFDDVKAAINKLDDKINDMQRKITELQIALVKIASKMEDAPR